MSIAEALEGSETVPSIRPRRAWTSSVPSARPRLYAPLFLGPHSTDVLSVVDNTIQALDSDVVDYIWRDPAQALGGNWWCVGDRPFADLPSNSTSQIIVGSYEISGDAFGPSIFSGTVTFSIAPSAKTDGTTLGTTPEIVVLPADPLAGYERYAAENWDGYGADPITEETLQSARRFLRILPETLGEPDIAPGTDGSIGLEWAFRDQPLRKLFIDVGPGNVWSGYWRRAAGEKRMIPHTQIGADTEAFLTNLFNELNS